MKRELPSFGTVWHHPSKGGDTSRGGALSLQQYGLLERGWATAHQMVLRITTLLFPNGATTLNPCFRNIETVPNQSR